MSIQSSIPHIIIWNRLEGRNRSNSFLRSLQAQVRDPLWMLSRQWQFGEFNGEDAGTAAYAEVAHKQSLLNLISHKHQAALSLQHETPLEVQVEHEPIEYELDLELRLEIGQQFLRILKKKLTDAGVEGSSIDTITDGFLHNPTLSFSFPSNSDEGSFRVLSDPGLTELYYSLIGSGAIDGKNLFQELKKNAQPASSLVSEGDHTSIIDLAGVELLQWFDRVYSQPENDQDSAWDESHLEYQFACSAPDTSSTTTVLSSKEYFNGKLDWYQFTAEDPDPAYAGSGLIPPHPDTSLISEEKTSVVPFPLRFSGMPNTRWWEFEDRQVDLGNLEASTSELGKLVVAEFALATSNDWLLIPLELPSGSISQVQEVIITDVFGQRTRMNPAYTQANESWNGWHLFDINGFDSTGQKSHLMVPNSISDRLEGDVYEQVNFVRDDVSNLVWGIETIVPSGWGDGANGDEIAIQTAAYYSTEEEETVSPYAKYKYLISSQVIAENWIPFIPVHKDTFGSREIQLQRAALPRFVPNIPTQNLDRIRPLTSLLRVGFDQSGTPSTPHYIFEEEIPQIGTLISKSWQRTRSSDGRPIVWVGKKRGYGRKTPQGGLRFDQIVSNRNHTVPAE